MHIITQIPTWWHLGIQTSPVRLPLGHRWCNNLRQVVHTLVPLPPSNISWYQCKYCGGNGRICQRCGLPSTTLSEC